MFKDLKQKKNRGGKMEQNEVHAEVIIAQQATNRYALNILLPSGLYPINPCSEYTCCFVILVICV